MIYLDILTVDGSPRGILPEDLYNNRGLGGAEKALMELVSRLSKYFFVRVFNNPREEKTYDNFQFLSFDKFKIDEENRILMTYRGPNSLANFAQRIFHVGFSCDQYTIGDYAVWYRSLDRMILISPYHFLDHKNRGYLTNDNCKIFVTDLGVSREEYEKDEEKNPYSVIYCSQPDRGLNYLSEYWDELVSKIPELNLNIFGGFSLWNGTDDLDLEYRLRWFGKKNVSYRGKVRREELVMYQKKSEALLYPSIYPELFNISTAECLSAGNYCITSNCGAIDTTNISDGKIDGLPFQLDFRERFIQKAVEYFSLSERERKEIQRKIKEAALEKYDWDKIVLKWKDEYLAI